MTVSLHSEVTYNEKGEVAYKDKVVHAEVTFEEGAKPGDVIDAGTLEELQILTATAKNAANAAKNAADAAAVASELAALSRDASQANANSAANSASASQDSADQAEDAAVRAEEIATNLSVTANSAAECAANANKAAESAANAKTSEVNAGVSADRAQSSSIAAGESSSSAEASASSAATSASTASTKAGEASTSATNAANSASSASESKDAAAASASAAATSETKAKASETAAEQSALSADSAKSAAESSASAASISANSASSSATAAREFAERASSSSTTAEAAAERVVEATDQVAAAKNSAAAAKTSETNAAASASAASVSASNASDSAIAAESSAASASSSATSASTSASTATAKAEEASTSATNASASAESAARSASDALAYKNDSKAYADAAIQAQNEAAGSAQNASTDAGRAEAAAGRAEEVFVQTLLKEKNLSDVSDLDITRSNLKVDKLVQETEHTFLYTDDKRYRLSVGSGEIVFQHDTDGQNNWTTIPFPIDIGGTGASTASEARVNLDVPANNEALLVENNLQDLADRAAAWLNIRPQGSTPLAGDPVDDYDATTKRWVQNVINSGTVGPTMNGVMNYGVGDFHLRDSRAYVQPYEVVSDGQLLNRADWPELWAYAQMLSPISDSDWLADPAQRGKYSLGDGSTTFRVPDRNGVQEGSIKGLFGRGDYGVPSDDGKVFDASLPNITASVSSDLNGRVWFPFTTSESAIDIASSGDPTFKPMEGYQTGPQGNILRFNASKSSAVYGRYGNTDNVLPRSFVGVWVIRASGGFVAANTSWSVINGDATKPATGTLVNGGKVKSEYKIGTNIVYEAFLQAYGKIDGSAGEQGAEISNGVQSLAFTQAGELVLPDSKAQIGTARPDGTLVVNAYVRAKDFFAQPLNAVGVAPLERNAIRMLNYSNVSEGNYVNAISGDWYDGLWMFGGVRSGNVLLDRAQLNIYNGAGAASSFMFYPSGIAKCMEWQNMSDERVKSDIKRISDPLSKMRNIRGVSWVMETNGSIGYGFTAQDVEKDFPEAVSETKSSPVTLRDGSVLEDVKSVNTSGVAAALHHEAILALMDQIEELKQEIAVLKASMQTSS